MVVRRTSADPVTSGYIHNNDSKTGKALGKIASAYTDDTSGLGVTEKIRSQIAGLSFSSKSAQNDISYVQTARAALGEIKSQLERGKALAEKVADGSYSGDQNAIDDELSEIRAAIDKAAGTEFGGEKIFDNGTASDDNIISNTAVYPQTEEKIETSTVTYKLADGSELDVNIYGLSSTAISNAKGKYSQTQLEEFADSLAGTNGYVSKFVSALVTALPKTAATKKQNINIGLNFDNAANGTLAFVRSGMSYYVGSTDINQTFELNINLNYTLLDGNKIAIDDDMAQTITHEMTHALMFDTVTKGMLGRDDKFPDWFVEGAAQSMCGAMDYIQALTVGTGMSESEIKNYMSGLSDSSSGYDNYAQGYLATMYLGYLAGGKTAVNASTIAGGIDNILSYIAAGNSLNKAISEYTGFDSTTAFLNDVKSDNGAVFIKNLINAAGSGNGSLAAPGGLSAASDALLSITSTNDYFNLDTNSTAPSNSIAGGLEGGGKTTNSGGTVDTGTGTGGTGGTGGGPSGPTGPTGPSGPGGTGGSEGSGGTGGTSGTGSTGGTGGSPEEPTETSEKTDNRRHGLVFQLGARTKDAVEFFFCYGKANIGNLNNDENFSSSGLGLNGISLNSTEDAEKAIEAFTFAINKVDAMNLAITAVEGRLGISLNGSSDGGNYVGNEADKSSEEVAKMMNFTVNRILSEPTEAFFAQACYLPENVYAEIS